MIDAPGLPLCWNGAPGDATPSAPVAGEGGPRGARASPRSPPNGLWSCEGIERARGGGVVRQTKKLRLKVQISITSGLQSRRAPARRVAGSLSGSHRPHPHPSGLTLTQPAARATCARPSRAPPPAPLECWAAAAGGEGGRSSRLLPRLSLPSLAPAAAAAAAAAAGRRWMTCCPMAGARRHLWGGVVAAQRRGALTSKRRLRRVSTLKRRRLKKGAPPSALTTGGEAGVLGRDGLTGLSMGQRPALW